MDHLPFDKRLRRRLGRNLRDLGTRLMNFQKEPLIWIDVGAHLGETTMQHARLNPSLIVFAFEPNWSLARQMMGKLPNFVVLPMAVWDRDGIAEFYLNAEDETSSLLPFDPDALQKWKGGERMRVESRAVVPTMRLDTFLQSMNVQTVDYLKIDTQGADFAVVRSAGERLKDIQTVKLEVDITPVRVYQGSASREDVVAYMESKGFTLLRVQEQSFRQEENLTFVRKNN